MTIKELCKKKYNMNNTKKKERIGLGILEYYVDKLENAENYETMSYASDVIYGVLVGLNMTNYINDKEFESLNRNIKSYQNDFFNRMNEE